MRTTYIKKNSHTQQQAKIAAGVRECAIAASRMTRDEWISMMFEFGCQRAEAMYGDNAIYHLNGELSGYWDWWYWLWLDDDKLLLAHYGNNIPNYITLKRELLK